MSNLHNLGTTEQRSGEIIAYTNDVTNVGSSPTVSSVHIFNTSDFDTNTDSANLSGSSSVSGNVITIPLVTSLTDQETYRVVITYTISGNTFQDFFTLYCEDNETA